MNNALRILTALDGHLNAPVDLTLYGKAALLLGLPDAPAEFGYSRDVDGVLWLGQAEELAAGTNFWQALEQVNAEFEAEGLYMTHLFEEDQVILRPQWRQWRVPIRQDFGHLSLHRLSDLDLLLSKLMRDDPVDFGDAKFIVDRGRLSRNEIEAACAEARLPDDPDVVAEYRKALERFRPWLAGRGGGI